MGESQDTAGFLNLHKVKQHIFIKAVTKWSRGDLCLPGTYLSAYRMIFAVLSLHEVAAVMWEYWVDKELSQRQEMVVLKSHRHLRPGGWRQKGDFAADSDPETYRTWAETWIWNGLGLHRESCLVTDIFYEKLFASSSLRLSFHKTISSVEGVDLNPLQTLCLRILLSRTTCMHILLFIIGPSAAPMS